mmetsp:Transcript_122422/g.193919  ORF Transcript_122422/g.193919 Transcript_122422/m.193919 type:complete len:270 (-) Transcript_122422:220-1029(-)
MSNASPSLQAKSQKPLKRHTLGRAPKYPENERPERAPLSLFPTCKGFFGAGIAASILPNCLALFCQNVHEARKHANFYCLPICPSIEQHENFTFALASFIWSQHATNTPSLHNQCVRRCQILSDSHLSPNVKILHGLRYSQTSNPCAESVVFFDSLVQMVLDKRVVLHCLGCKFRIALKSWMSLRNGKRIRLHSCENHLGICRELLGISQSITILRKCFQYDFSITSRISSGILQIHPIRVHSSFDNVIILQVLLFNYIQADVAKRQRC